jgi:hypothetical protein
MSNSYYFSPLDAAWRNGTSLLLHSAGECVGMQYMNPLRHQNVLDFYVIFMAEFNVSRYSHSTCLTCSVSEVQLTRFTVGVGLVNGNSILN